MAILIFGAMIAIHELGHFLVARVFKVKINEFAIGMGPKLFSKKSKKSDILYSLRAFPVGGYVNMEGENEASDVDGSFSKKPAWQKLLISLAGPFMNIMLGFVLTFILVIGARGENGEILLASTTVNRFNANAVSSQMLELPDNSLTSVLLADDRVVKVGNVSVHTGTELFYEISMQCTKVYEDIRIIDGQKVHFNFTCVDLTVERNGEIITLKNVAFPADSSSGVTVMGDCDFLVYAESANFGSVMKHTWFRSLSSIKMVWDSLVGLFSGRFGIESLSGPIGTTEALTTVARAGWYTLLYFVTVISMNLGVFNLLPILPLDGGHNVFYLYELIARKPAPEKIQVALQVLGVVLLFGLMIIVSIKDVIGLFG